MPFMYSLTWFSLCRPPTEEEISDVLEQYAALRTHGDYTLPTDYPVSCLLGCVDITDCIQGEILKEQKAAAGGDIEATECGYGFICANPCRLPAPPKILGQPKLYSLDRGMHTRAMQQLREVLPNADF